MITLTNDFHGTSVNLRPDGAGQLSVSQVARARRTLCGVKGCTCGGDLGERGPGNPSVCVYPDGHADVQFSQSQSW